MVRERLGQGAPPEGWGMRTQKPTPRSASVRDEFPAKPEMAEPPSTFLRYRALEAVSPPADAASVGQLLDPVLDGQKLKMGEPLLESHPLVPEVAPLAPDPDRHLPPRELLIAEHPLDLVQAARVVGVQSLDAAGGVVEGPSVGGQHQEGVQGQEPVE